jgi:hypothetical protein
MDPIRHVARVTEKRRKRYLAARPQLEDHPGSGLPAHGSDLAALNATRSQEPDDDDLVGAQLDPPAKDKCHRESDNRGHQEDSSAPFREGEGKPTGHDEQHGDRGEPNDRRATKDYFATPLVRQQ